MRWPLVFLTGCSTALSSINDAEVELIRPGTPRAEVEKIVGKPDATRLLENGGEEVTYRVTLGIPATDGPDWSSSEAADQYFVPNQGFIAIIPFAIGLGTFVVAEGIETGKQIERLNQGERHDVVVTYDARGEVTSIRVTLPATAKTTPTKR
ncbi:MAG: hypothetical protein ACYTGZ_16220 [Planctomycetota bacterium]|jgi:hypothetical protein